MPFTVSVHKWTSYKAAHSNKVPFRVNCYQGTYQYRSGPITNANTLVNWENDLLKKNLGAREWHCPVVMMICNYVSKDTKTSAAKSPVSPVHFSTNLRGQTQTAISKLFYRCKLCICTQLQYRGSPSIPSYMSKRRRTKRTQAFYFGKIGIRKRSNGNSTCSCSPTTIPKQVQIIQSSKQWINRDR